MGENYLIADEFRLLEELPEGLSDLPDDEEAIEDDEFGLFDFDFLDEDELFTASMSFSTVEHIAEYLNNLESESPVTPEAIDNFLGISH